MKIFSVSLLFLIIYFSSGMNFSSAFSQQDKNTPLAVVTGFTGKVDVRPDSSKEYRQVYFGIHLRNNYIIRTGKNSTASILFSSGNFISIGPNSNVTISSPPDPSGNENKEISDFSREMFHIITKLTDKGMSGIVGMKRAGEELALLCPVNSVIRDTKPTFEWTPLHGVKEYHITLFDIKKKIWTAASNDSLLLYPQNEAPLEYGGAYFWKISAIQDRRKIESGNAFFNVLNKEDVENINEDEKKLEEFVSKSKDEVSKHFFKGAFYKNKGLFMEAIHEFKELIKTNPESELVRNILRDLYDEIGLEGE